MEDQSHHLWPQKEAEEQLQTSMSINDLRLIFRYFPFENPDIPVQILTPRIQWIRDQCYTKRGKAATELLQCLLRAPESDWPFWDFSDSTATVEQLTDEVCHHFRSVYAEVHPGEWLRAVLQYDLSLFSSLQKHGQDIGRRLLENYGQEVFGTVSVNLGSCDLLAQWSISSKGEKAYPECLVGALMLPDRSDKEFPYWLKRVAYLSHRLQDALCASETYRECVRERGSSFLDMTALGDCTMPGRSISKGIEELLFRCSPRDFTDPESPRHGRLCLMSHLVIDETKSCLKVDSSLATPLGALVLDLHDRRNYFMSMPMLLGLSKEGELPANVEHLSYLTDGERGQENYWKLWSERPGLPFLGLHLHQFSSATNRGLLLADLFRFTIYLDQEDGREGVKSVAKKDELYVWRSQILRHIRKWLTLGGCNTA